MNYIIDHNQIIFLPYFNDNIDCDLLCNYNIIIFSDLLKLEYVGSKFNKSIDMFPDNITHIFFGVNFK